MIRLSHRRQKSKESSEPGSKVLAHSGLGCVFSDCCRTQTRRDHQEHSNNDSDPSAPLGLHLHRSLLALLSSLQYNANTLHRLSPPPIRRRQSDPRPPPTPTRSVYRQTHKLAAKGKHSAWRFGRRQGYPDAYGTRTDQSSSTSQVFFRGEC